MAVGKSLLSGLSLCLSIFLNSCANQPVVPDGKSIKLARENPSSSCREMGKVYGKVSTSSGTVDQAIEDMKLDAARKGANYVRMEATGAMGTAVEGTAFSCP